MMPNHIPAGALLAILAATAATSEVSAQGAADPAAAFGAAEAGVAIVRKPETGLVTWMSGDAGRPVARALAGAATLDREQAAGAFLDGQRTAFGLRTGRAELATLSSADDDDGRGFVRFQQRHRGVPIIGAELTVQLDGGRNVISVNGETVGDLNLSVRPAVSAGDARTIALRAVSRATGVAAADLRGTEPSLAVHDPRVMGGRPSPAALVWKIVVTRPGGVDVDEFVLVDARNGRVPVRFSQLRHAKPPRDATQRVCDSENTPSKFPCTAAAAVVNPGASAIPDVKSAFDYAEATYDFFALRFGRDSLDGKGLPLVSTVRYRRPDRPNEDYANAFWSSSESQMVYGKDFAIGKDVVGHELTHGFTSFSSNLLYFFQSGALDESMSDVFGELIERQVDGGSSDWLIGEDLTIGAIRSMSNPPQFNDPDRMTSTLWTSDPFFVDQGGVHTNSGVGNKTAFLITAGGDFNGKTVKAIGDDKAAAIYYRVNAFLLQSGSDYADLGLALSQACSDLVGKKPKDKRGKATPAITKGDCRQVAAAVEATELAKQPPSRAIPAEAAVCRGKLQPRDVSFEQFEGRPAKYAYAPTDAVHWATEDYYAASNKIAMYGSDGTAGGQYDTSLESKKPVKIPAKAFLRFAHFYNVPTNFAGGVIEYSVGGGAWQRVPAAMFLDNPYNATLLSGTGNVLAGQPAFSGFSAGWTSSRIDLSSLSGQSVRFRFRIGTDSRGAFDGWILDDIRIYTCKAASRDEVASSD